MVRMVKWISGLACSGLMMSGLANADTFVLIQADDGTTTPVVNFEGIDPGTGTSGYDKVTVIGKNSTTAEESIAFPSGVSSCSDAGAVWNSAPHCACECTAASCGTFDRSSDSDFPVTNTGTVEYINKLIVATGSGRAAKVKVDMAVKTDGSTTINPGTQYTLTADTDSRTSDGNVCWDEVTEGTTAVKKFFRKYKHTSTSIARK